MSSDQQPVIPWQRPVAKCSHCNGTGFCRALTMRRGSLQAENEYVLDDGTVWRNEKRRIMIACPRCLEKAGLKPKNRIRGLDIQTYSTVVCSICGGVGSVPL